MAARWLIRRPALAAALIYGLLSVVLYAPALLPGHTLSASDYLWTAAPWDASRPADVQPFGSNFELVDSVTQFQPFLQYTRERLPHAPLWNPYVGAGRPYLADAQSAVFSPFSLPSYFLPFWWSLGLAAVLKVFAAAFGTYLLARALGLRFGGALLSGLVFGFSLFLLSWVPWPQANVWALIPWLLLMTDRVARGPTARAGAGLAAVVALQFFGGHPESNFHAVAVAVAFFAFRVWTLRRGDSGPGPPDSGPGPPGPWRRSTLVFAGGLVGGTALAAIALVPFLELLRHSNDASIRQDFWKIHLPRQYLLGFVLPDYWGRGTTTPIGAVTQERALYVGALPLVLAVVALARRPVALRLGIAGLGLLMLAVVLGIPPLPQVIHHIPLVRTGNHLRLAVITILCLALLAGWGLDDLTAPGERRLRPALAAAAALLVLPVLVLAARGQLSAHLLRPALRVAWGFRAPPQPLLNHDAAGIIRLASLLIWLPFIAGAGLLIAAFGRRRLGPATFTGLALTLVALDLFRAGMGETPAIRTHDQATQPRTTPAISALRAQGYDRFVGISRPLGPSPLIPNMAMRLGLYDARSYDLPVEKRYDVMWRRAVHDGGPTDTATSAADLTPSALPVFRLLSVSRIMEDPGDKPAARPLLPLASSRPDARIYRNPGALPRAGVLAAQRVVPGGDAAQLAAVLDPRFDGRRTVVTGSPLPGLGTGARGASTGSAGSARIVDYAPEKVVVSATARRPSELVLTDLDFPGWKATLDGRSVPIHRVDYLLRGTTLPPGRHTVTFRYAPASWTAGRAITLVALLGLGLVLALPRLRRRVSRASRPSGDRGAGSAGSAGA